MPPTLPFAVKLLGIDKVSPVLAQVGARFDRFGRGMARAGKALTAGITAPTVAASAAIFRTSADFSRSINRVEALTGATGDALQRVKDQARELGATTVFTAGQAAEAQARFAQAGFSVNEILAATPSTLALASVAQLDMAEAASISSDILKGLGKDASQAGKVVDVLARASSSANVDLAELGEAFAYSATESVAARQSFATSAATLAALADIGKKGSVGGTAYRSFLLELIGPTKAAADALGKLGIKRADLYDSKGRLRDLFEIVEAFERVGAGDNPGLVKRIFGERAFGAFDALVRRGSKSLRELAETVDDSDGYAEAFATTLLKGDAGAMAKLGSAVGELMLAIADSGLVQWMTTAIEKGTAWVQELAKTSPALLKVGSAVALVSAAFGPALWGLGQMVVVLPKVYGALWTLGTALFANPIGLWTLGIAAAVYTGWWLVTEWDHIVFWLERAMERLEEAIGAPFELLSKIPQLFGAGAVGGVFGSAIDAFKALTSIEGEAPASGGAAGQSIAPAGLPGREDGKARVEVSFRGTPPGTLVRVLEAHGLSLGLEQGLALGGVTG